MALAKIRLEGSGPKGRDYRVFLNGEDISQYVSGAVLTITIGVNEPNSATIQLAAGIEIPNEIEMLISSAVGVAGLDVDW